MLVYQRVNQKKPYTHWFPVDFPLKKLDQSTVKAGTASSHSNHLQHRAFHGRVTKALESVDFDPVSVFWENQQNSEEHVIRASVTGSQWWRMWQHHVTMVRSMSEFLIQWGREHSRWFSFFWRREAWECSRFSVFLIFPGPKKGVDLRLRSTHWSSFLTTTLGPHGAGKSGPSCIDTCIYVYI